MTARARLGSWACPSGNSVDAFLEPDRGDGVRRLVLEWTAPPPLPDSDLAHYLAVILPALACRVREYLETPGPVVGVVLA